MSQELFDRQYKLKQISDRKIGNIYPLKMGTSALGSVLSCGEPA